MNMNSEIVVLIPAYNPEERIINYVKELKEKSYTVIIVNDGSDEKHHAIFESLVDDCKIINCPYSKGKGNAIKKGLSFVKVHNQDKKGVCILEEDYPVDQIEKLNGLYEQNIFFVHSNILSKNKFKAENSIKNVIKPHTRKEEECGLLRLRYISNCKNRRNQAMLMPAVRLRTCSLPCKTHCRDV